MKKSYGVEPIIANKFNLDLLNCKHSPNIIITERIKQIIAKIK